MRNRVSDRLHELVLVGGGHAHVEVLRRFAERPDPGTRVTLVSRGRHAPYSGMLPGHLAGQYALEDIRVDLERLAAACRARLIVAEAEGLDLDARVVLCAGRPPVRFDLLSLNVGSVPDAGGIEGAERHALPVKPLERFLAEWPSARKAIERRMADVQAGAAEIVVVGGGAGGAELALSLRRQLAAGRPGPERVRFTILPGDRLLPGHSAPARRRMRAILGAKGIEVADGCRAARIGAREVVCEDGRTFTCDSVLLVTQAAPPHWLRDTDLALDEAGFVRVDRCLRSQSHPQVFAAGDVIAWPGRPLPRSGVFSVRQGPVLARNLRAALHGGRPVPYRPQRLALALISTGGRHAVASYGPLAVSGRWVWRVKNWIDRRWVARYRRAAARVEERSG